MNAARKADITFSSYDIWRLRGPLVYVLWSGQNKPLYVGVGTRGVGRPLNPFHHAIKRDQGQRLEVHYCTSPEEALELERTLIRELDPIRNRRRPGARPAAERGMRQIGNGRWQVYVRINGRFMSRVFPIETPREVMRQWRQAQKGDAARARLTQYLDARCTGGVPKPESAASC